MIEKRSAAPLSPAKLRQLRAAPVGKSGNRLAEAMRLAGMFQAEVAVATGFTQPYVSDIVRGRWPNPKIDNAGRFANLFGCYIEDLFPSVSQQRAKVA